jgi:hypothetical protein
MKTNATTSQSVNPVTHCDKVISAADGLANASIAAALKIGECADRHASLASQWQREDEALKAACPCCRKPLYHNERMEGGKVVFGVHCGYGPCKSKLSNAGADGATLVEAVENLLALMDEEVGL